MYFGNKLLISGLMAIFLLLAIPAAKGQVQFSGPTNYPVGAAPQAIATGDLNGDGIPDLAVANAGTVGSGDDGNVSIFLGNGDGTFRANGSCAAGKNPWSIVEGDFNHDGNQDLAVRDEGETSASILLGNGDGSFQAPVKFTVGPGGDSETITAANFDGDENLDLAVANSDGTISVLLGNGDGTFRPAVSYGVWGSPIALIAGDFNHDQKLDIAVSSEEVSSENYHGKVIVLLGNGDGSFQPPLETIIPSRSFWIAPGDFNGDGLLDIVVVSQNFFQTTVLGFLLGKGDGTFDPPDDIDGAKTLGTILASKGSPVVADFNGDQKLDVAVVVNYLVASGSPHVPPVLRLLLGNGDGTFQAREDTPLPSTPKSLSVGDFNRDKRPDVVVANQNNISILLNTAMATDFPLLVTLTGSGIGNVTSSPAGIDCGGSCTANFPARTSVILTASPNLGSTFSGWGGPCSGTGACTITVDTSESVTATFDSSGPPPDFLISPAMSSLSLLRGNQASDVLTLLAQGGFSGTIALKCSVSGPSPMPACGISPASVTPGTNATLTVNAASLTASVILRPSDRKGTVFATVLPLGLICLVVTMRFKNKQRKFWVSPLLIIFATILPAACGGNSNAPPPPQKYTVTVTALSGAIQHSTTISVTVN